MSGISPKLAACGSLLLVVAFVRVSTAQTVTYSLGAESDLLDAAFYAGEAADGSDVAGRFVINIGVNNAGTEAVFWAINASTQQQGLFRVEIGEPSSWERLTADEPFNYNQVTFSPDDTCVLTGDMRYTLHNGSVEREVRFDGVQISHASVIKVAGAYWILDRIFASGSEEITGIDSQIILCPIFPNGTEDPLREPVVITNFGGILPVLPWASSDGTAITFLSYNVGTNPDQSDVYVIENIPAIVAAPKIGDSPISNLAPTSLGDVNVVEIRASETLNHASGPSSFSPDGQLVFYAEDFNNVYDYDTFFTSIFLADFDIGYSFRDGLGDVSLFRSGNQATVKPFASGSRLMYVGSVASPSDFHAFVTTLTADSNLLGQTSLLPENDTTAVIGGNTVMLPFALTDSGAQITVDVIVSDASGTSIELPTDQVINFPDGTANPEISIFTPIDPVAPIELPDPATQIPVIRTFGPAGTQFYPPITITISYTQAEIRGIFDETLMIPYLYNTTTQEFEPLDEPFLSTVVVDPVANTLTFQTDHFSTYGIGFSATIAPQRPWAVWMLVVMLGMLAGVISWKRRKTA